MKINSSKPPESKDAYLKASRTAKPEQTSGAGSAGSTGAADKVDLSSRAREIADIKNTLSQLPEIRAEKVQALEKAIAAGTYKTDSQKIAGRMIDELI